jgi:hypothetical protein
MKKLVALALAFIFTMGTTQTVQARACEGVTLPNSVTVDGTALTLNGMGIREATALQVNVYVAGLYLETASNNAEQILASDTKKRIVLRFVRDVGADDIRGAFREGFHNNSPSQEGALRGKIDRLLGWVADMEEGQTMQFTYVPGTGLTVVINGATKGTIDGVDFQRAFFALFIGPRPPNSGLKVGLLGGRCG